VAFVWAATPAVATAQIASTADSGSDQLGIAQPDSALASQLAELAGEPLGLAEALRLALTNATAVGEARAGVQSAQGATRRERGAFDPELFADVTRLSNDLPASSPFSGAAVLETNETVTTAGARMQLTFGTEIEARFDASRLETNSQFAALSPEYRTTGVLEIRQPLLKGFGPAASGELRAAERTLDAADSRYLDTILATRASAESLYWQLHAAERDLAVQKLIAERAAAFLEQTRTRAQAGLTGPNDVANAEVFLAQQQLAEIELEERLDAVSDQLAALMGMRPTGARVRYHAVNAPPRDLPVEPLDALIGRALERNRQLRAAHDELEALRAVERGARWDALPSLDLIGAIGGNGLAGTGREVIFGADTLSVDLDTGFGDTWSQVWDGDFPTWWVGLELSVPIGLREGRGERDRLRAEIERAEQRIAGLRRDLEVLVRARHREMGHGVRRLEVAERGVAAAYEQVRIGVIEFENGRSTAFELVRLGEDLATAQQQLSDALVRTASAHTELRRLTAADVDQALALATAGAEAVRSEEVQP
jgi:outer membrane protein TolC